MKEEGDERTPAGIYRIGAMFGFAEDKRPNYIQLAPGRQFCVEDTSSPYYGQIVSQSSVSENTLGQKMASEEQFRRGLFIDYPPRRAFKAGSCIFVQVWRGEVSAASAHIGLPEETHSALAGLGRRPLHGDRHHAQGCAGALSALPPEPRRVAADGTNSAAAA